MLQQSITSCIVFLFFSVVVNAQNKPAFFKDSTYFLTSFLNETKANSTLTPNPNIKTRYTRPNNQLINWRQDYPLTIEEIQRRQKRIIENRKLSNAIAKDVIKGLLSRKNRTAVIPHF